MSRSRPVTSAPDPVWTRVEPVTFRVTGKPESKGSARAFIPKGWTQPVITSTNKNLKAWESVVRNEAQRHATGRMFVGPVWLTLQFGLPRPKAVKGVDVWCDKRPDCSKLVRSVEDALIGVLYADDSQIVMLNAGKRYANEGEAPFVEIDLRLVGEYNAMMF